MLNRQYAKDGLTDLKYVAIDIKIKDDATEAGIYGLFLGYKALTFDDDDKDTKMNEPFVWIYSKKCVYLYSLKYYEIRSIEISLSERGKTTQFTNFTNKQDIAVKSILEIVEALKEQGKMQPNGLIDVYKYETLPSNLKDCLEDSSRIVTPVGNTTPNFNTATNLYKNRNSYSYTPPTTYKPKRIETFFIERTSRYSVAEALEKMKEKIEKVKNGTYRPPKLKNALKGKEDLAGKTDEEDDDENNVANNEDFYGGYGGMCAF